MEQHKEHFKVFAMFLESRILHIIIVSRYISSLVLHSMHAYDCDTGDQHKKRKRKCEIHKKDLLRKAECHFTVLESIC